MINHVFLIICVLFANLFLAQTPIAIDDAFENIRLSKQLQIAEDKSKAISFKEALKLNYQPIDQDVPNFGFNNSSYWIKGFIVNKTQDWKAPILEISNPNIDVVSIYVLNKLTGLHKKLSGDFYPYAQRQNDSRNFQFNLKILPNDTLYFYLNIQNSGEQFHVPIMLGSEHYFRVIDSNEQLFYGLYFGFILFVIFLTVFIYFILKEITSLYYLGYLVCLLLLQSSLTGFGFKYLWPSSIYLANHANPIFASISMLFLLFFAQEFLNTHHYLPKLNKGINMVKYFVVVIIIAAFVPVNSVYVFSVLLINILSIVFIFTITPSAIYILKQKYKPARFFLLAFVFLIISVLLFVLKNAGVLPSNCITNYGFQIGSALQVLLLMLAVLDKFNQFRVNSEKALMEVNAIKTKANQELELKVEERTKEINEQRVALDERNSEVLSSIRYAKRIQDSLMPSDETLVQLFDDNYFVYYNPKDIVSGDFYWASPVNTSGANPIKLSLAAVIDCTGHGVPGAFLSIVVNNFLKQSLTEPIVNNVSEALDYLNQKIITALNQAGNKTSPVRDGMDIALIAIDYTKHQLYYSGANNPLYIYRNNGDTDVPILNILTPTKQAIGSVSDDILKYDLKKFDLQAGDTIYLFTDGYADQFGGTKDKKYNYKNFKQLLAQASLMPIAMQKEFLHNTYVNWKGSTEQTDDVCIMGIKI